ncbi:3-deoxy-7-phosphoheptulonate synthase [Nodularia spumigena CS-584]|jgi:3-deoxy-7-phosphoheptulonate synthase|uniref:Phospho-2-dehydro-3-deoxyheptonate aldolase n=3 Tax=Nodularia spumigena TaxID=70799 RepID=A0A2S0Q8H1_NODSP|nr:3-deoxy-7-phosphoheptulonate synthase [Nodularia spumigena]AHJ30166.1 2-keto-3-deoxy-D-arabino-heptulosonate-7- phosphate synthase I alpha [Nodularia spumigena CCY9414]AVZ30671.1 phospho-2-dehydro-3-deoxyheptonate aldolase, Tyr-sensitive [Nodularia spumigena UHCC 0039]EAW46501.1 3-deoxy-7-phosphoheptulonate synthase [Nodularia spumigena CCY9414]KZL51199.1 phospho-2-dehydro-3-deoxyheptonate aldolase [Nodularia spumigena CENA596]MDB9381499.1 3-deoxy-7-phosphoheptulonate synthase [Nodularia sp
MHNKLFNTNIKNSHVLLTPNEVKSKLPLTKSAEHTVLQHRQEIKNILDFQDSRKFIVVGPCSIHDTQAALEYSQRLKLLSERVKDKLLLIMRVYFEKPRTTVGWKGLINDPDMDDSFHVEKGLLTARSLLIKIAELGLPAGTEALDPIIPQYISELITWSAIGARTTESQTHREMASGLSMPVGFKNGTDGNIQVALNALQSAKSSHNFLGINHKGQVSVFETKGNPYGHVILRGGSQPNFEAANVQLVEEKLKEANLPPRIVIDCSHGNTNKDYKRQPSVLENVIQQIVDGNTSIVGLMLESNLYEGNQPMTGKREELKYGVSVTDKCISWDETEKIILAAYQQLH